VNQPGFFSHPGKPGATIARLPGSSRRIALAQQIASNSRWPGINARAGDQCIVW
jgi:hypothetical protein